MEELAGSAGDVAHAASIDRRAVAKPECKRFLNMVLIFKRWSTTRSGCDQRHWPWNLYGSYPRSLATQSGHRAAAWRSAVPAPFTLTSTLSTFAPKGATYLDEVPTWPQDARNSVQFKRNGLIKRMLLAREREHDELSWIKSASMKVPTDATLLFDTLVDPGQLIKLSPMQFSAMSLAARKGAPHQPSRQNNL